MVPWRIPGHFLLLPCLPRLFHCVGGRELWVFFRPAPSQALKPHEKHNFNRVRAHQRKYKLPGPIRRLPPDNRPAVRSKIRRFKDHRCIQRFQSIGSATTAARNSQEPLPCAHPPHFTYAIASTPLWLHDGRISTSIRSAYLDTTSSLSSNYIDVSELCFGPSPSIDFICR